MRMNSRFLSGFLLSVILAGTSAKAIIMLRRMSPKTLLIILKTFPARIRRKIMEVSLIVLPLVPPKPLKRQTPTARIPTGKTPPKISKRKVSPKSPPKISKRKVPPKSPVKIPRKIISMPPRPQAPTMNWAACSPLFFQRP